MGAKAASTSSGAFFARVDQAFYDQVKQKHGGKLPPGLLDAQGNPRKLTTSPADRAYRSQWLALAAAMRNSKAVPDKPVESSCVPCAAKAAAAKIPAIMAPSKKTGKPVVVGKVGPAHQNSTAAAAPARETKAANKPCKNETLTVACSHGTRNYKATLPAVDGGTSSEFEVIDDGHETMTCTTNTTGPCETHQGKVFDLNPDDSILKKTNTELTFRALHDASLQLSSFGDLFGLTRGGTPQAYAIQTDTCQQQSTLSVTVNVYPQVNWDVNFSFGYSKSDDSAEGQWSLSGPDGEPLPTIGVTVLGVPRVFGQEVIDDLKRILEIVDLASKIIDFFSDTASELGGVDFKPRYPLFSFNGNWGWQEIERSPACGYTLDLTIGASPLIGASLNVDIITFVIAKFPVLGQVINQIRNLIKKEVDFEINLDVSGQLDGTFHLRESSGTSPDVSGTVKGSLDFKAESVVKAEDEADCLFFSVNWGVGGKLGAVGGLHGDIGAGYDGDNYYYQGEVQFDGVDVYAVAAGGTGFELGSGSDEDEDSGDAGKDSNATVEGKIDTSDLPGNVLYERVWHLLMPRPLCGNDEKHVLFTNGGGGGAH